MVDSAKKKHKRKKTSHEDGDDQAPSKTHRITVEDSSNSHISPWRNLQLILSLQNRDIDLQKKVDLCFSFIKSREGGVDGGSDDNEEYETVKTSRLLVFLNDWVQSLLISVDKKFNTGGLRNECGVVVEACLDFRCWMIFKFCLEEALKRNVALSFSRNLLRAIGSVARSALPVLKSKGLVSEESCFVEEGFELCSVAMDCVSLVFSSEGGFLNENLDLWVSTIDPVLELVLTVYSHNLGGKTLAFAMRFCCLVLEPFAKFLVVHPTRKNGFRDFVDKLLEPLMHLGGILHEQVGPGSSCQMGNLIRLVEEVLANGLFHPTHIDGFMCLRNIDKYIPANDDKLRDSKTVIKSYHRHLFDKLESFIAEKKILVLNGIGQLFHLLVDRVKRQKGVLVLSENTKIMGKFEASGHLGKSSSVSGLSGDTSSNLNAETRKLLFEFFVQMMEPLLIKMDGYDQAKLVMEPAFLDVLCTLKSINRLLASFMHEKIYIRTEDMTEGAFLNFLKKVHDVIMSFASHLLQFLNGTQKDIFTGLAKEVLSAVGYFLDIEYEVIGHDLISLWLIIFSYLGIGLSFADAADQSLLTNKILNLGCQLVNLYSELRQVSNTIFALCKALRLVLSTDGEDNDEASYIRLLPCVNSLPHSMFDKSVGLLLSSQEFKISFHNAIKSIPEGQASGCIRELAVDLSQSLEWMKENAVTDGKEKPKVRDGCVLFDLQAEFLGRYLSELYTLVLDSLIVTMGNSNLLGPSIKDLMTILCPCISNLLGLQPESVSEFLLSVTGQTHENRIAGARNNQLSSQWLVVIFFRLYMSCRSLYRQAISLMPPNTSKKMSAATGDSFTAYSGKDWMEKSEWISEGYFSWILQPSASVLDVIKFVSDLYLIHDVPNCSQLIFVLLAMALQRLVDLNRQIKSLDYLLQNSDNGVQLKLLDEADPSRSRKKHKKWKRHISLLRQEAAGLSDFVMEYIAQVTDRQAVASSVDNASLTDNCTQEMHESSIWNLCICAIDEKSLPTAIWWIVSLNIDIWCAHATPKKLKMFLSVLICTALAHVPKSFLGVGKRSVNEAGDLKNVAICQLSTELLTDSIFYEHKFVCRHMASRFCRILEKSALSLFSSLSIQDVDFSLSSDWRNVLGELENSYMAISEMSKERKAFRHAKTKFTSCHSLLNLLSWMPKGHMNSKSIPLYFTHILNLERIIICSLFQHQHAISFDDHYELLRLFLSCRRTLKHIVMTSFEENTEGTQTNLLKIFKKESDFVLWLFKSVSLVISLVEVLPNSCAPDLRNLFFPLMDHTSYIFLKLTKDCFSSAIMPFTCEKSCGEQVKSGLVHEQDVLSLNSFKDAGGWQSIFLAIEALVEQAKSLVTSLKGARCDEKLGVCAEIVTLNKLSSAVACFSGILWGLASALNHNGAEVRDKVKSSWLKCEPIAQVNPHIITFADFIGSSLRILVGEDDKLPGRISDAQTLQEQECGGDLLVQQEFLLECCEAEMENSHCQEHQNIKSSDACPTHAHTDNELMIADVQDKCVSMKASNCPASFLAQCDLIRPNVFNNHLLQCLLKGDLPEAAFLLRQLFIAAASILRLNLQINSSTSTSRLIPTFIGISEFLLLQLADTDEVPEPFTFVWLDGVLRYLEELGSHFALSNPSLTRNVYAKLVELHLKAIGKCISLQGKKATLASHETESSTKILGGNKDLSGESVSPDLHCLDEYKARLRMSFKVFINKPSDLHLLSAIQCIERALVGVKEGSTMIYEINTSGDGGKVSSIVAAGVDCLDLVLEYVSGRKRLSVVKRQIQNLIAALFSIIVHLQSSLIFFGKPNSCDTQNLPDSGSVILMCIEVLTRVSGKHALFEMDTWHVAQCLRIPGALFQDIHQLRLQGALISSNSMMFSDNQSSTLVPNQDICILDQQLMINIYAACCKLLYTILKHHKSESERCIALLQESVRTLLQCLETVDADLLVRKGYFTLGVQEGIKCASFLRRIYEEVRQQKDVFGRHVFKFLSTYIWIYSGLGPQKMGIRREIDEALRPGVYALIDACSADDLQYLHTVFGEGPCRNNLATLQHDYKLNFRYEGKV